MGKRSLSRCRWTSTVFALSLALAAPLCAAKLPVEDLFQKALVKESVERDMDGAIRLYQQVIDQAHGDRAITAEAQLRMGICFEKIGKPVESEQFYHLVVAEPTGVPSDVFQQARTNLQRVEAQMALENPTQTIIYTRRFRPYRYSFLLSPTLWVSGGTTQGLSIGLRYRTTADHKPLAWYLESLIATPLGSAHLQDQSRAYGAQSMDQASLSLKAQGSLGLVAELPHGEQRAFMSEVGAGFALTASKISYISASSTGDQTTTRVSPYVEGGVHLFPDRMISFLFQTRYIANPYAKSVDITSPVHSQSFGFPSSLWALNFTVQIKTGYWDLTREVKQR